VFFVRGMTVRGHRAAFPGHGFSDMFQQAGNDRKPRARASAGAGGRIVEFHGAALVESGGKTARGTVVYFTLSDGWEHRRFARHEGAKIPYSVVEIIMTTPSCCGGTWKLFPAEDFTKSEDGEAFLFFYRVGVCIREQPFLRGPGPQSSLPDVILLDLRLAAQLDGDGGLKLVRTIRRTGPGEGGRAAPTSDAERDVTAALAGREDKVS